ncbi:hypothetical protein [Sulfitobacter guttiformis]|uniref:Concanavalin A-like lectin/glucanase superfamily protein n=1 Tax=Sulfitobacter guttiformis TaxID=74349 RepID=A0A420DHA3_9RHOB|nr:hypothetical protein [Sulfitobacter guttiformis]KIN72668.1 hypothetical protein Z949_1846 [Sulfitobacter guttiformis KCTC 32187]RKE93604.1 hypothetical protein C8N30_2681 [Sulfitobacter guttiformis]
MKKIFAEGWKQYADAADLAQNWTFGRAPILIHSTPALSELRGSNGNAESLATRSFTPTSRVALSADVRIPADGAGTIIGFNPAGYASRNRGTSGESPKGVYLNINGLTPRLYYDILTGPTGSAVNSVLLASGAPVAPGQTHHIEIITDHSEGIANTRVYINGALSITHNYPRDRILSGFQALTFGEAAIHTFAVRSSDFPMVSNVFCYDPQDSGADPVGPLDIEYLLTPISNLGVGPARDSTGVPIIDNAWRDFDLSNTAVDAEIVDAEMVYRLAAINGQGAASAELALESLGLQVGGTAQHTITPGYAPKIHSFTLPSASLTPATINGLTLKARSIAQGGT